MRVQSVEETVFQRPTTQQVVKSAAQKPHLVTFECQMPSSSYINYDYEEAAVLSHFQPWITIY